MRRRLLKNVHATPEQLRKMYGKNMEQFFTLKNKLDPERILKNDFFDRIFGSGGSSNNI